MASLMETPQQFEDDDVDFGDPEVLKQDVIPTGRWERARDEIDVRDVIDHLYGKRGSPMSCPFHGRDSKPSFYIFMENNTCFCFGCPGDDGYWDNIKIVSRSLEIPKGQALRWLEREYNLPPWEGGDSPYEEILDLDAFGGEVEEEEPNTADPVYNLNVADLEAPFIRVAAAMVRQQAGTTEAVPVALSLVERLFQAQHDDDPMPLAKVLGADAVRHLVRTKRTS
jgi:hypothetical protein